VESEGDMAPSDPAAAAQRRPGEGSACTAPTDGEAHDRCSSNGHRIPHGGICHEPTTRLVLDLAAGVSEAYTLRAPV